jgi:ceramide glucosyltransferase
MILFYIFSGLALLSVGLCIWQWLAAMRFPFTNRCSSGRESAPSVTLLKPLKGCDEHSEKCLRSWLMQDYPGPTQVLFGVRDANDPVCAVVGKLTAEFSEKNARLIICPDSPALNPKISTLMQLEVLVENDAIVISDADVEAPRGYLRDAIATLQKDGIGLVNSFYRLANPRNSAMWMESIAANCDFWAQVCQSNSMFPMKFALGAVMTLKRDTLKDVGGFEVLGDYIADDNRLGLLVYRSGRRVELTGTVVDCYAPTMTFREVWDRQVRWARTIRSCEPVAYFFSVLANVTLWLALAAGAAIASPISVKQKVTVLLMAAGLLLIRCLLARQCAQKLGFSLPGFLRFAPLIISKDVLNFVWWLLAFTGSAVEWRGERHRILRKGRLQRCCD